MKRSMRKFCITTLGCKVNQCESDALFRYLKETGWGSAEENTDICIINTCTVTQKASMQSRQAIRKIIRANPHAKIIVTGCYAQADADEIRKITGVHYVVGHSDKHRIAELIESLTQKTSDDLFWHDVRHERVFREMPAIPIGERTRPFLKIQDGCDAFCTYCIVPYTRGRSRSMRPEKVLESLWLMKEAGYKEAVLSGVHLGCYGLDLLPKTDLFQLLCQIDESEPIDRVRLSSVEPHELRDEIIQLTADSQILCRHFHIPLQSGDDEILCRMRRPYTRQYFRDLILKIHTLMSDAAIGADILVGFPGESDAAFENTYRLIQELPISYLHVFPFSARKNTPAAAYSDNILPEIVKIRTLRLRELGTIKRAAFYQQFIGQTLEVLVESKRDERTGLLKGFSSNYVPVFIDGESELTNTMVRGVVDRISKDNKVFCRV